MRTSLLKQDDVCTKAVSPHPHCVKSLLLALSQVMNLHAAQQELVIEGGQLSQPRTLAVVQQGKDMTVVFWKVRSEGWPAHGLCG
jgi:hypothetical protein